MRRFSALLILLLAFIPALSAFGDSSTAGLCWFNYHIDGGNPALFSIYRDSAGRTWLGATNGLYRFNGYQAYACETDGEPLRAQVYAIAEHGGSLYAGTNNGLFRVNPATGAVEAVVGNFPREIRSMICRGGVLWMGSLSGLYIYDIASDSLSGPVNGLPHPAVYSLLEASDGTVWIGTYNGLARFSPSTAAYSEVPLAVNRGAGGNLFVNTIAESSDGKTLYIGTETALISIDLATDAARTMKAVDDVSVKSIETSAGNLVVGTDDGLFIVDALADRCAAVFRHDSRSGYSISSNVVWSLMTDDVGNIWAGTEGGLSIIDMDSPVRIFPMADITRNNAGQQVYNFLRDSRGDLWVGGTNGVIRFPATGKAPEWFMPADKSHSLSHNRVRDIAETSDGGIWVATDGGINRFNPRTQSFENHRITDRRQRVNANWAYNIVEAADSSLWVAGYLGGVFVEKTGRFGHEGHVHVADTVLNAANTLPNDYIGQMIPDANGKIWVLHFRDSALTRIDPATKDILRVPVERVAGSTPAVICADARGNVWCGLYDGLMRISSDGVPSDTIVRFPFGDRGQTVIAMAPVGADMWVATNEAVWAVDVSSMQARVLPLPTRNYTSIYYDPATRRVLLGADDEIVEADPRRMFDHDIEERISVFRISEGDRTLMVDFNTSDRNKRMRLPSDNHSIVLDVGTAFFSPGRYLRFCYRLDRGQWQLLPDGDNRLGFTSLLPGDHKIEVAIAGFPASACTVNIGVDAPWYRSNLALAIYAMAAFMLITGIISYGRRRHRRRLEEIERNNALTAVENRLFFLSNISHDLKTPLSMIIGPLSKVRTGEPQPEAAKDVDTAYENALKLNTLIHQALEINRMELGRENMLIFSRIDAVEFCRDIFESYRKTYPSHNFVFSATVPHIYARVDAVKLESLVTNLLSNAVKYSPEGSTIAVAVSESAPDFEISVSDSGVGIPESEQKLVFQRLYRSPRTAGSREGTGIGLYLVRQYAEMLGGSVHVESRVDEGSTFRLRLPLGDAQAEGEAVADIDGKPRPQADNRPRVLIVDDNRSIAEFIQSVLSKDYNCAIANDGKAGLTVAASFRPDMIIADEMMPVMSGLEMSRRLKSSPATAAVPILLVTAKDTPGIHGESISSGVDAFMPKPFEAPVLKAKVAQLLEATENIRRSLRLDALTTPEAPAETESASEKQLAAVTAMIENNLSNPDLNVDFVCRGTGIASKALYRLVKKYTGVSPVDYIRQTRLRKAAVLLEQNKFSVSEVMYMVGFSSSSYFSKCFSAMFGCTPGQYSEKINIK